MCGRPPMPHGGPPLPHLPHGAPPLRGPPHPHGPPLPYGPPQPHGAPSPHAPYAPHFPPRHLPPQYPGMPLPPQHYPSTTPLSPTGPRRLRTIPSCRPACRPVGGCRAEEGPTYFTQPDATWRLLTAAADPGVAMALRMVYTDTDAGGTGRARLCAVVVAVLSVARRRIWYILIRNCSIVITCVQATLYRVSVF